MSSLDTKCTFLFFQVIMDPNLDWDKNFVSPASSKESKATLDDRATFWKAPSSSRTNGRKATHTNAQEAQNATVCQTAAKDNSRTEVPKPVVSIKTNRANREQPSSKSKPHSKKITSFFDKNATAKDCRIVNLIISDDEKENGK